MSLLKDKVDQKRLNEFFNNAYWYHTFDLGNGIVTKGVYDLRTVLAQHGFDESLVGKSVLDVGTSDGFYAFEFEKRGAKSVLAVDTNAYDGSVATDPSPAKMNSYINKYSREKKEFKEYQDIFSLLGLKGANKILVLSDYWDSLVKFKQYSIYELEKLERKFDLVFCGALIGHLKHPLLALEQLRSVTADKCIITLNGALPVSKTKSDSFKFKLVAAISRIMGLNKEISVNERDLVLKYVGNISGGSFFHIHPTTFREMLLASGFRKVEIVGEYDVVDRRLNIPSYFVIFHSLV